MFWPCNVAETNKNDKENEALLLSLTLCTEYKAMNSMTKHTINLKNKNINNIERNNYFFTHLPGKCT